MNRDDAVTAVAEALLAEGAAPGSSLHSWRCEYPDRYGPCSCVPETAAEVVAALEPYIAARIVEAVYVDQERIYEKGWNEGRASVAAETEALRVEAAALRTSVAWHERMGPINAMAAARLAKTVALSAPGLVDTSTQEYRTALADAVRGIQQQARAEAEAERDEARQIARDMIDQRDEARAALAAETESLRREVDTTEATYLRLAQIAAAERDEARAALARVEALARLWQRYDDRAQRDAARIFRVIAGNQP